MCYKNWFYEDVKREKKIFLYLNVTHNMQFSDLTTLSNGLKADISGVKYIIFYST